MKLLITIEGPPGTGKTLIAQRLAGMLIGATFGYHSAMMLDKSYTGPVQYRKNKRDIDKFDVIIKVKTKQPKL